MIALQGKPSDIGGYYKPDENKFLSEILSESRKWHLKTPQITGNYLDCHNQNKHVHECIQKY